MKRGWLVILALASVLLIAACKPQEPAANFSAPKVLMIYIPEDYTDANNLNEIHIANITINNGGKLNLTVIKDGLYIQNLRFALEEIESGEGLFLEYEDKVGDTYYLKSELVSPTDPRYIYALEGELAIKYGFGSDIG